MNDAAKANLRELLSLNQWMASWYSFLELLDIDYEDGFCCPTCGKDNLDVVVCDGTSLSFRQAFCTDVRSGLEAVQTDKLRRGSRHEDRIYVLNKDVRKALVSTTKNISAETFDALNHLLDSHAPRYEHSKILLIWCVTTFGCEWPDGIVALIVAIEKNSPICAIFHGDNRLLISCHKILDGYPVKKYPADFQLLYELCPLLFQFLCAIPDDHLPKDIAPLLKELLEIASSPFVSQQPSVETQCTGIPHDSAVVFFPNNPVVRERGHFVLDKRSEPKSDFCTKRSARHPTLLPGIFLVQCRHGITYGFSVMTSCESPNVPFTIFRTRFMKAPSVIVYDNACNLHTYSLNRDPVYFKHTRFLYFIIMSRGHFKELDDKQISNDSSGEK